MKKSLAISLAFCSVLILSLPALSKQPPYKALFDLGSDSRYYQYVEYLSSHRFEHALRLVFVDKRPEQEKIFNEDVQWFSDDMWTKPPSKMLQKIFFKELRLSKMFTSVDVVEKAPSFTLKIELNSLVGHYARKTRTARGVVEIHSILRSASHNRIIMDNNYEKTSSYRVHRFANAYKHMLYHIGKALHILVVEMMTDLEVAVLQESGK